MSKSPEYSEIGGCKWGESYYGGFNVTWPLASLRVTYGSLVVSIGIFGRTFSFSPKEVVAIRKYSGFLAWGIQIEHSRSDCPPFIAFWSFSRSQLLKELANAGFSTEAP
jgi:hypothetical protein